MRVLLPLLLIAPSSFAQDGIATGESELEKALSAGNGLGRLIALGAHQSREVAVNAVYQATVRSGTGAIVKTGTLTPAVGGYVYSPAPKDKLVVKLPGATHEFVFTKIRGSAKAATPQAWLEADHELAYSHRLAGRGEGTFAIRQSAAKFDFKFKGWFDHGGRRYSYDLRALGKSAFESDRSGHQGNTDFTLSGTIKAKNFDLAVDEVHKFVIVTASARSGLKSATATQSIDTCRNTLKLAKSSYQWVEATTVKAFFDGRPSRPLTDWKASGQLLKDGKPYGKFEYICKIDADVWKRIKRRYRGKLLILLNAPDQVVVLEHYRSPQGLFR